MTHWRRMFPDEKYLGAWDLEGRNGAVVVIASVKTEELKSQRGTDRKPVAYFQKGKKGMVLNKTNCRAIAGMYGTDTADWIGKPIEIYATTCSAGGGEEVECLRVRTRPPAMPQQQASADREMTDEEKAAALARERGEEE